MNLKKLTLTATILVLFSFTACSSNKLQKQYGKDYYYFAGIKSLEQNKNNDSAIFFEKAAKRSSPFFQRKAWEALSTNGSINSNLSYSTKYYKAFPDNQALLVHCRNLDSNKEGTKIVTLTQELNLQQDDNELIYLRLKEMQDKKYRDFESQYLTWSLNRPFTKYHSYIYEKLNDPEPFLILRNTVFLKKYTLDPETLNQIITLCSENTPAPQILSDLGKYFLYGSNDFYKNAQIMENLANRETSPGQNENNFYSYFYAGRLYEKAKNYKSKAGKNYLSAMDSAINQSQRDNALWYYLNLQLKESSQESVSLLEKYGPTFGDPNYYDDYFDTLCLTLINRHSWDEFYRATLLAQNYASKETAAKFSYLSGRFIQEGYLKKPMEQAKELFLTATDSGSDMYYRLLAANQLIKSGTIQEENITSLIYSFGTKTALTVNPEAEKYLMGLADFGFTSLIYDQWILYRDYISMDTAQKLSLYLFNKGRENPKYLTQSLRIAARKANYPENTLYPQLLELVYPQNYSQIIADTCQKFSQSPHLLYGLIRSESFFNQDVISHAGAIGLTQLMESTAGDVARKLKIKEYNLRNPETNILFGSFYLEELIRRLDGSRILAVFSYNGGISRVRKWVKSAQIEFGTKNLSMDLFLEALPYAETREYGRKVLSAACLYGWLYYGKTITQVIEEIMN